MKWEKAANRSDKSMTLRSPVCDRHFEDDDIIRDDVTVLSNGKIHRMPRDKPKLKENAVPRLVLYEANENRWTAITSNPNTDITNDMDNSVSHVKDEHSYYTVDFGLDAIRLPSEFWTAGKTQKDFFFCCWDTDLTQQIVKRVIVYSTGGVQVHDYY